MFTFEINKHQNFKRQINLLLYLAKLSVVDEASVLNDVLEDVAEHRVLKAGLLEKSTGSGWLVSALLEDEPDFPLVVDDLARLEE